MIPIVRPMPAPKNTRAEFLDTVHHRLAGLAEVFSSPQWGGRAYKLPGPGGKPKLVAHVGPAADGRGITISFKLGRDRAEDLIERHGFLEPHSFRTLAPSGWVTATVRTKRQLTTLGPLLDEAHAALSSRTPRAANKAAATRRAPAAGHATTPAARHIDRVMTEVREGGWTQADDGWAR